MHINTLVRVHYYKDVRTEWVKKDVQEVVTGSACVYLTCLMLGSDCLFSQAHSLPSLQSPHKHYVNKTAGVWEERQR